MYVSRAVAGIRDDPVPDATVSLALETNSTASVAAVAEEIEAAGATVDRRLPFGDLEVSVDQERVDAICRIEGIGAVFTADAIRHHTDELEEDVVLEEREGE